MANAINYASIFTQVIDGVVQQRSTTQILEAQNELVRYNGGKTVNIAKIALSGLANYSRANGFVKGSVALDWEPFTFSMDRGRRFDIDVMDEDEANFVPTASVILGEFTRTQTVPEIDAYRLSKIAGKAYGMGATNYSVDNLTADNVFDILTGSITKSLNAGYASEELVVFLAYPIYNLLINSAEIVKRLDVGYRTPADGIETRFYRLNGVEIIPVMSDRMKSGYTFASGTQDGDSNDGGFAPLEGAVDVNFLVVPKRAALAIVKHVVNKVIPPELNQSSDGYIVALRVYHDIFFPENASVGIVASFATSPSAGSFPA